jgi:hypothetical protein
MGSIYKRGDTFWIKYYRNGKPYRESTRSKKEADAKRLLKKREGEIAGGKLPGIYFDKVLFDELAENFLNDYRINAKKSLVRAERSLGHLKRTFEGYRVINITADRIGAYIDSRLTEGAANATINRELAALKRMLNLGKRQRKVDQVPYIPMLEENNVRKGFFEHPEFIALRNALPCHLKGFVTFGYKVGWRVSEIANLTWHWCPGPELNRHGTMCRGILSPLRLPVPPPGRQWKIGQNRKSVDGHQVPYTGLDCKQKRPAAPEYHKAKAKNSLSKMFAGSA